MPFSSDDGSAHFAKGVVVPNPDDIRNESFSLLPTGYSPEQVDGALNLIAEAISADKSISTLLQECSFELTEVGYDPTEVDAYFAGLATLDPHNAESEALLSSDDGVETHKDESDSVAGSSERSEPDGSSPRVIADSDAEKSRQSDDDIVGDAEIEAGHAILAAAPADIVWQPPANGVLDLDVLCQAVDRTGETLASLRGFIDNEVGAMKLAVERQAHETAKRCEQLMANASAEARSLTEAANEEISRASRAASAAAERERRELAKELKQLRAECDAEVTQARKDAEAYSAKVRADADADRAEAQRTIQNAIEMQASIAESLERARNQLTPTRPQSDELAA
jgi:DivIVA domain-containing protein